MFAQEKEHTLPDASTHEAHHPTVSKLLSHSFYEFLWVWTPHLPPWGLSFISSCISLHRIRKKRKGSLHNNSQHQKHKTEPTVGKIVEQGIWRIAEQFFQAEAESLFPEQRQGRGQAALLCQAIKLGMATQQMFIKELKSWVGGHPRL